MDFAQMPKIPLDSSTRSQVDELTQLKAKLDFKERQQQLLSNIAEWLKFVATKPFGKFFVKVPIIESGQIELTNAVMPHIKTLWELVQRVNAATKLEELKAVSDALAAFKAQYGKSENYYIK